MKLHFKTKDNAPYSFDYSVDIISDEEFNSCLQDCEELEEILNFDDVLKKISCSNLDDIRFVINLLFDMTTNGMFNWVDKTYEYYNFFDDMLHELICSLENEAGDVIKSFECELSDEDYKFSKSVLAVSLCYFNTGNGEPAGAQLALDMVDKFMNAGKWHLGFYDSDNILISNIPDWAKGHILDVTKIKPIVWFGVDDNVAECWSVTPETQDHFLKEYWDYYLDGALPYICKAHDGMGIYYSVGEYDLDYDESIFEKIKSDCPIDLNLPKKDRTNALYNLVILIYNEHKAEVYPLVQSDNFGQDIN